MADPSERPVSLFHGSERSERKVPQGLSPAQLRKVMAPVHLTVDVERRFDGHIERFIVNEV